MYFEFVVLDEAQEELARLVLFLHRGQEVGELEEHLVHAIEFFELRRGDVGLDGLEQPLLLVRFGGLLLRLQRALLGGRRLEDLLVEAARRREVVALLLGVELGEAEVEVGLLGIVVLRDADEPAHLDDLRVDQLLHLLLLLVDELVDRDPVPSPSWAAAAPAASSGSTGSP
jgi:hypothetical protein